MMLLCTIPIVWAAITDFKKRIIPDWTWIAILLIGGVSAFFFETPYLSLFDRIAGLLLSGINLLIIAVKYGGIGGGDIKLVAAMGFCFGLSVLQPSSFSPSSLLASMLKQQGKRTSPWLYFCLVALA